MRKTLLLLSLFIPASTFAANAPDMTSGDMQGMMEQMQQMQQCMESIDQEKLNELQERSEKFTNDLDTLCALGKRDEAQDLAITYSREMANEPTLKQIQKCSSYIQNAMSEMMLPRIIEEKDIENTHVCDQQ